MTNHEKTFYTGARVIANCSVSGEPIAGIVLGIELCEARDSAWYQIQVLHVGAGASYTYEVPDLTALTTEATREQWHGLVDDIAREHGARPHSRGKALNGARCPRTAA